MGGEGAFFHKVIVLHTGLLSFSNTTWTVLVQSSDTITFINE